MCAFIFCNLRRTMFLNLKVHQGNKKIYEICWREQKDLAEKLGLAKYVIEISSHKFTWKVLPAAVVFIDLIIVFSSCFIYLMSMLTLLVYITLMKKKVRI